MSANGCQQRPAEGPDHVWCWDFVFDRTTSGSQLKWLSIVDEYTRECLALKVARSITSEDVIDTLAELFAMRGVPQCIRSDNGPEFIAQAIQRWTKQLGIESLYIEPGSPWENGYAESFHSRLRDELLAVEEFENVPAARKLTGTWKEDYNHHRPHSSLGYVTPVQFAAAVLLRFGLRPSLRSTAELPNPYLHNPWYRKSKLVSTIGDFWESGKSKKKLWDEIKAIEKKIGEAWEDHRVRKIVKYIHELVGEAVPFEEIRRSYSHAANEQQIEAWLKTMNYGSGY